MPAGHMPAGHSGTYAPRAIHFFSFLSDEAGNYDVIKYFPKTMKSAGDVMSVKFKIVYIQQRNYIWVNSRDNRPVIHFVLVVIG